MQHLWLPLLIVFVLFSTVCNPLCWTQSQYQEIEMVSGYIPDSTEGDRLSVASLPVKNTGDLLLVLNVAELMSVVSGSDAYPSSILHGPPVTNSPV
jgi:hypothetical protein